MILKYQCSDFEREIFFHFSLSLIIPTIVELEKTNSAGCRFLKEKKSEFGVPMSPILLIEH